MTIIIIGIYLKRFFFISLMISMWFLMDWMFQLFFIKNFSVQLGIVIVLELLLLIHFIFLEVGYKNTMKGYQ